MRSPTPLLKHFLVASDFDETLTFHDSGTALSELVGIPAEVFKRKVAVLAVQNLVQQGGELAYLLRHDPEYRSRVRREDLIQAGKGVRLKHNISELQEVFAHGIEGYRFELHVVSAAPHEVVMSALEGIVPADHIHGTQLVYDASGHVESIVRVNAGYGKVAVLDDLQAALGVGADRIVYIGDGVSDIHVMMHVNRRDGFTIAVSESRQLTPIARRTVLSDNVLSVLVPLLEELVGWEPSRVRALFEREGLQIQGWDKMRADWLTFGCTLPHTGAEGIAHGAHS